ncbi:unnamed protein product [Vitrella brassicaformis CCMP3155]|uniref:Uncharacterized protein n=1 Tax=Vitrella brassicaformis (strain CCMP3155) TaxID=1169540 RepID=A0A0G4FHV0_VITBC|nr:unnamed protein product [Vitrella brassicaformis CCMP3155]|eukprot:CEM13050.1 unnamed protein product [Vitrella brassicaformis CCMP3155]
MPMSSNWVPCTSHCKCFSATLLNEKGDVPLAKLVDESCEAVEDSSDEKVIVLLRSGQRFHVKVDNHGESPMCVEVVSMGCFEDETGSQLTHHRLCGEMCVGAMGSVTLLHRFAPIFVRSSSRTDGTVIGLNANTWRMSSVTVRAYKAVERIVVDGGDANLLDSEVLSLTEDQTQCMELVDSTDILPPHSSLGDGSSCGQLHFELHHASNECLVKLPQILFLQRWLSEDGDGCDGGSGCPPDTPSSLLSLSHDAPTEWGPSKEGCHARKRQRENAVREDGVVSSSLASALSYKVHQHTGVAVGSKRARTLKPFSRDHWGGPGDSETSAFVPSACTHQANEYTDAFLRLASPSVCAAADAAVPKTGGVASLPPSPL